MFKMRCKFSLGNELEFASYVLHTHSIYVTCATERISEKLSCNL